MQKLGLWGNIAKLKALRMLESDREISDDRLYDLVLMATGSERQAQDALKARVHAKLAAGLTPDLGG